MREPRLYDTVKEKGGRPKTIAVQDIDGDRFRLLDIPPVQCTKIEKREDKQDPDLILRGSTSYEVRRGYLVRIDQLLQMIASFDSDEVILATADLCMKILKDGIRAEFTGEEGYETD